MPKVQMVRYADNIVIPATLRENIEALGVMYHADTGKELLCTSGLRDEMRQATAMYDNYKNKRNVGYQRADLEKEIKQVFDSLYPFAGNPATIIIRQMADKIKEQIARGQFLSYHLIGQAADFSLDGLEYEKFAACCLDMGAYPYKEVHCAHVTFGHA